jgi:holliday junction DNA helicase RuvA
MFNHLNGRLIEKNPAYIVIECGGVGYFVNISLHTYSKLPEKEACKIFIHLQITEDAHTFYGFADEEERRLFKALISVSGVGCNTARMMLSSMQPAEITECIVQENAAKLKTIKGIGEKTALRAIVELKDKLKKDGFSLAPTGNFQIKDQATSALVTLGFSKSSVDKILDQLLRNQAVSFTIEDLVKEALKRM